MKLCKDCSSFSYCLFAGYTEDTPAKAACHLYERKWWKFWRPA